MSTPGALSLGFRILIHDRAGESENCRVFRPVRFVNDGDVYTGRYIVDGIYWAVYDEKNIVVILARRAVDKKRLYSFLSNSDESSPSFVSDKFGR